jgi:hypothetical protein
MPLQPNFFNLETFYYKVYIFLQNIGLLAQADGQVVFAGYWYFFAFKVLLIFISVFLTFMTIDFFARLIKLRREESEEIHAKILSNMPAEEKKNQRWEEVQKLLASDNESNLKLAIIEADKLLDDLLTVLGYTGESIGDKLLKIERGDMESLDDAWEAHKYRNRIAHERDFHLSEHDARRVIALYAKVFREFEFI